MRHPEFNSYCLERAEHWRAGCFDNLDPRPEGLTVTSAPVFEPIPGTGGCDLTPALATDVCGRLFWLRPSTGELVRLQPFGPQVQGRLLDAFGAESLVVGATRLWVLKNHCVLRYAVRGLQYLDRIAQQASARTAIAGDGGDGLWRLGYGNVSPAALQRFNRYGEPARDPLDLGLVLDEASLAAAPDGRHLVILARPVAGESAQGGPGRDADRCELLVIDTTRSDGTGISRFDALAALDPEFHPRLLAVDGQSRIHVADPESGAIWTLNLLGELVGQIEGVFPEQALPLTAISAGERTACGNATGIGYLGESAEAAAQGGERRSVFISPTLISPEGKDRGWQRVDVDALLPEGTSLEISCVATRNGSLIRRVDEVLGDSTVSAAVKANRIQRLLDWPTEGEAPPGPGRASLGLGGPTRLQGVVYPGAAPPRDAGRFRYLLHEITETHLWLRLVLRTPPSGEPPRIGSVRVYYPNLSYLRYLPAVYQEDPASAAQLRRFLAPFESLFGDLDLTIDRLAAQIDPRTAPDERLPFLLRWLGLPSVEGLKPSVQRELLLAAPELLADRGTLGALGRLLDIVAGVPLAVEDLAAGPAPWVLQNPDSGLPMARLGRDTLVRSKRPHAFRLGHKARPGVTPLGDCPADPVATFAQQAGELRLSFCTDRETRERIEPIVRRFLPYFIPAHCRYRTEFVPPAYWTGNRRLDEDLFLVDEHSARIGGEAVVGRLRLPASSGEDGIIGRSAVTGESRLN